MAPRTRPGSTAPTGRNSSAEEEPCCSEAASCFRLGTDSDGNAYIAVSGQEDRSLADSRDALRRVILDLKAGRPIATSEAV